MFLRRVGCSKGKGLSLSPIAVLRSALPNMAGSSPGFLHRHLRLGREVNDLGTFRKRGLWKTVHYIYDFSPPAFQVLRSAHRLQPVLLSKS